MCVVLLIGVLKEGSGNKSTLHRIRRYFPISFIKDCSSFENENDLESFICHHRITCIFALHAFHSGKLFTNGCSVPFTIMLGGTDINTFIHHPHCYQLMYYALNNASSIIVFSEWMKLECIRLWPKLRTKKFYEICQAVTSEWKEETPVYHLSTHHSTHLHHSSFLSSYQLSNLITNQNQFNDKFTTHSYNLNEFSNNLDTNTTLTTDQLTKQPSTLNHNSLSSHKHLSSHNTSDSKPSFNSFSALLPLHSPNNPTTISTTLLPPNNHTIISTTLLPPNNHTTTPTTLPLSTTLPLHLNKHIIFTMVTGLRREKDPLYLLEAFQRWSERCSENVLLLVIAAQTNKDYANMFMKEIIKYSAVLYMDNLPRWRVDEVLSQSFALVNSSQSEGMCLSILEAMQQGVVVVARDIVGNKDLITHLHNGLLYHTPQDFIVQAEMLLSVVGLREALIQTATQTLQHRHSQQEERHKYMEVVFFMEKSLKKCLS